VQIGPEKMTSIDAKLWTRKPCVEESCVGDLKT